MGEFSARSSLDIETCLLRDALFFGCMFIGFMSSRAGLVTTFETLKFTWFAVVVVFCGLFLYIHGKIYSLTFYVASLTTATDVDYINHWGKVCAHSDRT